MGSYLDKLARGEQDMFLLGWSSSPDCDSALMHYSILNIMEVEETELTILTLE